MGVRDRSKLAKLGQILTAHRARERRTIADIRNLGYRFASVDQATRHLKARETLSSMTDDQIASVIVAGEEAA